MKKFIKKYGILLLLLTFCVTEMHASKIYKIYRSMNIKDALRLNGNYGIKANTSPGREIEVRVYLKDYYTTGGRADISGFLYGGYTDQNYPDNYLIKSWDIAYNNAFCILPIIGNFTCLLTGGPTYIQKSTNYKNRLLAASKKFITALDLDAISYVSEIEVVIELELTSDYSALNDVKSISLPGMEILYPWEFGISVKGINYEIRTAAEDAILDALGISYTNDYIETFTITTNRLPNEENLDYEIAIPRKIKADVLSSLPAEFKSRNSDSFTTNMVVYPSRDEQGAYFYLVSAFTDISQILIKMTASQGSTFTSMGSIFDAYIDGVSVTFYLYKVNLTTSDRVLFEKIDDYGPFPAAKDIGLKTEAPILATYNRKMLAKHDFPEDERIMVAWHRGFWRDYPENTLQSVEAAKTYLSTSDILELDVSRAGDLNSNNNVYNYILFHDPFMFRESSIGPNNSGDQCVDPYDKLLVESSMLSAAKREELKTHLKSQFVGYTDEEYNNWILGPSNFTLAQLTATTVRDRFGCLTNITIPNFDDALDSAMNNNLSIVIDKGWDDIDNIYWHAVLKDYENHVFFKGGDSRDSNKLTKMYGDELFRQIAYTPFYFDSGAQKDNAVDSNGNLIFLQDFLDKEANEGWIMPGVELQIKRMVSDGSSEADGFYPIGTQRLLDWADANRKDKWIGITQINPTAYNGFDNKIIYMDAGDKPINANAYSSRWDRRADLMFNVNYLKCDYWTTDRPDMVVNFLKAIGKIKN